MSFATDKACILDKVRLFGCRDVAKADALLTGYGDVLTAYYQDSNTFDCNPKYLSSLLSCIDATQLLSTCHIYFNHSTDATDPALWVDGSTENIILATSATEFAIVGNSRIGKLTVNAGVVIDVLTIGGGATLDILDVLATGTVKYLRVSGCKTYKSSLGVISRGSDIRQVKIDDGVVFGDFDCLPVTGTCSDAISDLTGDNMTSSTIVWTWNTPSNSLYTILKYRAQGDVQWVIVPTEGSNYLGNWIENGFVLKNLSSDTYYEVSVVNVCNSGQLSAPVIGLEKTT